MSRTCRLPLALLASLVAGLAGTSAAQAAPAPAKVRFTAEGAVRTLVSQREITTTDAPAQTAGAPCPGTSAGGALDVATSGKWTGAADPATGAAAVTSILGDVFPNELDPRSFVLMVNSVVVAGSPCNLELNSGDTVLYYLSTLPAAAIDPSCRTNGRDGLCGSIDRTGPPAQITAIKEQQRFAAGKAPLTLSGTAGADPNGVADVRIRLTRVRGKKCHYYSGIDETFLRSKKCGADGQQLFSIGSGATWSYLLPRRMTPGRYTLDVQAVDALGNASVVGARGRDRIVFFVR
ncbi:hypothetical protein DSM112329_02128 [Paraconexibacter sp. AEG42_29]|uniref:Uncharacterized protein n=1 Tax=Paraconexibacter sp. AEG42_29 TaxID=2997339 RepID=A0AAU7AUK2_9ACTN